ncbi:MAG: hypothetical protein HY344_03610 [Candidatus Levybacteria bacterium]|nr:hypothetical protein [Candidatus Levybacteria bacterium]
METEEKSLPLPEKDLPLPEKEITSGNNSLLESKWVKIGLVVFLLVIVGAGAFVFGRNNLSQNQEPVVPSPTQTIVQESPTPTPDTSETKDWKTYLNSQSQWEMKYPVDLTAEKREASQIGPTGIGDTVVFYKLGKSQSTGTEFYDGISITVGVSKKSEDITLEAFADEQTKPNPEVGSTRTPVKKISINGLTGVETYITSFGNSRTVYLEYPGKKDRTYYISIVSEGPDKAAYDKTAEMMLQTFKSIGNQTVCTQEAKLCPDGSYVGRTGPNCEFATCP